ncbi:hypothetical protein JTE90_021879 [Oedothorax gibbosus]|uniref:Flavin-containing monooxygenase n=1 Tax=Oedothorax gibbosus TaxID=931172 RepID=A0AAV6V1C8_9ARAC|nr:hypothetical protein JTE90_021879 [Oedothorax gibbosus]
METKGNKRICVIGAGSSGLTAIKACKEDNFDVVCYEKSDTFGGIWWYHSEDISGRPSVMRSTVINTSKEMCAFSDFPPPSKFANFMHNTSMIEYFRLYAEKFDLFQHVLYNHEVTEVNMADDYESTGRWTVTVKNTSKNESFTETFDGVLVCSGHHIYPNIPNFKGLDDFKGTTMHTHSLKSSDGFEGKRVLVIGIGNSAVDAAVEISKVSKQVYLSTRKGSWIFSRLAPHGAPYDVAFQKRFFEALRSIDYFDFSEKIMEYFLNFKFDHEKYGLKPKHGVFDAHVTVNDALPNCVVSGTVIVKQNVKNFTKGGVIFEEEDEVTNIDAVVMATGYEIKFPFLSEKILKVSENNIGLYKFVFPPHLKYPSLAFIALVQPLGAMFPIAEAQSRWFTQLMKENVQLPSTPEMEKEVEERRKANAAMFVDSLRHTVEVFWIPYMDEICSEFGAKPNLWKLAFTDPVLFLSCLFGPCTAYQFRLQGPHTWDGARESIFSVWDRVDEPFKTCKRD